MVLYGTRNQFSRTEVADQQLLSLRSLVFPPVVPLLLGAASTLAVAATTPPVVLGTLVAIVTAMTVALPLLLFVS